MLSVTFGLFSLTKSTHNSSKNLMGFVKIIPGFRTPPVKVLQRRYNTNATKLESSLLKKINSDTTNSDLVRLLTAKIYKLNLKANKNHYCTTCEGDKREGDKHDDDLRYRYHEETEKAVNNQITTEFTAALSYLSMACYFGRTTVGLPGTREFYLRMYDEEVNHAFTLIKYQEMRGGHVEIKQLKISNCGEDCSIQKSLELALQMEKTVADQLSQIMTLAKKHQDIRTEDFIITDFMKEQVQSIRNIGNLLTIAHKMAEDGLSQYMLDKQLAVSFGHTLTIKNKTVM